MIKYKKLKNLEPVFFINLSNDVERRKNIEKQLDQHGLTYTRVDACNGRKENLEKYIHGGCPSNLSLEEAATSYSHLLAIRCWLETSNSETAVICEDDLDLSICKYWGFTWDSFLKRLPPSWQCVQLATINHLIPVNMKFHKRRTRDWSACCYVLKREHAKKLVDKYFSGDKVEINCEINRLVADTLVYEGGETYSLNLFSYNTNFESNIHQSHIMSNHIPTRMSVLDWWKENKNANLDSIFD